MCADRLERLVIEVTDGGSTNRIIDRVSALGRTGDEVSKKVGAGFRDMGNQAAAVAPRVNVLGQTLRMLGLAMGVGEVLRLSDSYTVLQNRLSTVTTGSANLQAVLGSLFAVTGRTYQSISATVDGYVLLAQAGDRLGLSQQQLITITENLEQVVRISGRSMENAGWSVHALSRAMELGTVSTMELRSIVNQLPVLAQLLADHFNTTVAGMKLMLKTGQVSAQAFVATILESSAALQGRTSGMLQTIGQAVTQFQNRLTVALGEATPVTQVLVRAIVFLGDNLWIVATAAIPAVIAALWAMTVAASHNPFGLVLMGIGALVSAIIGLNAHFRDIPLAWEPVVRAAATFAGSISGLVFGAFDAILAFGSRLPAAVGDLSVLAFNAMIGTIRDMLLYVALQMNILLEQWESASSVISKTFGGSYSNWPRISIGSMEALPVNPYEGAASALGKETGKAFTEGFDAQLQGMWAITDNLFKKMRAEQLKEIASRPVPGGAGQGLNPGGEAAPPSLVGNPNVVELQQAIALERELAGAWGIQAKELTDLIHLKDALKKQGISLTEADVASLKVQVQELGTLREKNAMLNSVLAKEHERATSARILTDLYREQHLTELEYNRAMREGGQGTNTLSGSFEGVTRPIRDFDSSISAVSYNVGTGLVEALDKASGAMADFAITGFQSWRSFRTALADVLNDIGKMILQLIIKMLLMQAIQAAVGALGLGGGAAVPGVASLAGGGGGAGVAGAAGGIAGFAGGGDVQGGRPIIVGEGGKPELFVPPSNGRIIPNSALGVQAPPIVNVHPAVVLNPEDIHAAMNVGGGHQVVINAISKNKAAVKAMLA